jgi:Mn-containing catalase
MSNGRSARGPWTQGQGPWGPGESWEYIEDPVQQVMQTQGNIRQPVKGTNVTREDVVKTNQQRSQQRSREVNQAVVGQQNTWSFSGKP